VLAWIRRHPNLSLAGGIAGVAFIVFVFLWFEPHKAFIDERVDETIPQATPTTTTSSVAPTSTTAPPQTDSSSTTAATTTTTEAAVVYPLVVSETTLMDVAHGGSGTVLVLELEDGSRVLRFEDLDVDNGPDLVVILSDRAPSGADDYADGEYLALGDLKGNQGNQNYEIPADVDLSEWASVAIWCRRFNTTFNVAAITG
jgi:hypothetical protein